MAKVRCNRCYCVCDCYFDHCKQYLCHIDACTSRTRWRRDHVKRFVSGISRITFTDHPCNGGRSYLLPRRFSLDTITLMRLGYARDMLVLEVEEYPSGYSSHNHLNSPAAAQKYWIYVKPITSQLVEWSMDDQEPRNLIQCRD
jgi:hypothetical protein